MAMRRASFIFSMFVVLLGACIGEDRLDIDEFSVEVAGATSAQVDLSFSRGQLELAGGSENLIDTEFVHLQSDYEPSYEYEVVDERGMLVVDQPSVAEETEDSDQYISTVNLTDDIPIDLRYVKTAGEADLNLEGLPLTSINAELGGTTVMTLSGDYPLLTQIRMTSLPSSSTLNVMGSFPALTNVTIALDSLVEEAHSEEAEDEVHLDDHDADEANDVITIDGDYPELIALNVATGEGDDKISLVGSFPTVEAINLNVGAGVDRVDLTGEWQHDMDIVIVSVSETTEIQLPATVGVQVQAESRSAQIFSESLVRTDETTLIYTSENYDEASVRLHIVVTTGAEDAVSEFNFEIVSE